MRIIGKTVATSVALAGSLVLAACSSGSGGGTSAGANSPSAANTPSSSGTAPSASSSGANADIGKGKSVAFLLPENTVTRWEQQDGPFFKEAMKKYAPGADVKIYNALGDPATQLAQAKTALTAGASVLVIAPADTSAAAAIVTEAHNQKVPVISYSRLIQKAPVDYFIGKDSVEVGRDQGTWLAQNTKDGDNIVILDGSPDDSNAHLFNQGYMSVLQPLFDSKKRTLAGEIWVDKYDPAKAQAAMEQLLTKNHNNVQGVLAANDGIAGGVVAALRESGLQGKVTAITGLDATLAGVQRILQGTQGMSILQPIHEFANGAAELTAMLLQGQTPPASFFSITTDNGAAKVPTHAVKIDPITKDNVTDTISGGLYTKDEVCKDIPAGTGPC